MTTDNVVDMTMRRKGQILKEAFGWEDDEEFDAAYPAAQSAGAAAAADYSTTLGPAFSGQQVALGALRYAFDEGGAAALKEALEELQSAAAEWTK